MDPIKVSVFSLTGCEVKNSSQALNQPADRTFGYTRSFIKPDSGAQKVELNAGTGCSGCSGLERKALKTRSLGKISDSIKKRSFSPIVDD
ncbi:hypothetical protein PGT21_033520 [Puccinia graminis f. sp. tritici]|uniref:Uncharacterized protein n=1 Tax=Puccinia graminis f. sp. tritici TaxID=56615 RepID=A0A5B0QK05_PUCGR|nr:hypothetical protein PGT21_033520 [Puccinia graminis f. sp. tritici]